MSKREWKLFLEDILKSIKLIESYVKDMGFGDFEKDRKTIDAVVRNLEIIGEATKYIPQEIRNKYPKIDWQGMFGLRNRIANVNFGISLRIVWEIIQHELPKLKEQMENLKNRRQK